MPDEQRPNSLYSTYTHTYINIPHPKHTLLHIHTHKHTTSNTHTHINTYSQTHRYKYITQTYPQTPITYTHTQDIPKYTPHNTPTQTHMHLTHPYIYVHSTLTHTHFFFSIFLKMLSPTLRVPSLTTISNTVTRNWITAIKTTECLARICHLVPEHRGQKLSSLLPQTHTADLCSQPDL